SPDLRQGLANQLNLQAQQNANLQLALAKQAGANKITLDLLCTRYLLTLTNNVYAGHRGAAISNCDRAIHVFAPGLDINRALAGLPKNAGRQELQLVSDVQMSTASSNFGIIATELANFQGL